MSTVTAVKPQEQAVDRPLIGFGDPIYAEVMNFLNKEAALLDREKHMEWVELLADDVAYTIPTRRNVRAKDGPGFDENAGMPANYESLRLTAERNTRDDVFDHDPRHRMRRFITNVQAYHTDKDNEFAADSYILFLKSKYDEPNYDFISAERRDVLRKTPDGMKLARRRLIFDQTMLSLQLPNIIL